VVPIEVMSLAAVNDTRLIDAANAGYLQHLQDCQILPSFCSRKEICYEVACTNASGLSAADRGALFALFEDNMRVDYETTWGKVCMCVCVYSLMR
jgi:hypothetical protein